MMKAFGFLLNIFFGFRENFDRRGAGRFKRTEPTDDSETVISIIEW